MSDEDTRATQRWRIGRAVGLVLLVVALGTGGYYFLGAGRWSLVDCAYMTVITLSTVGYAEVLPGFDDVSGARAFTAGLIVLGSGSLLYFLSSLTAFIIEGDLVGAIRSNRMQKRIDNLERHVVVCGAGSTGIHIVRELALTNDAFVAIDINEDRLKALAEESGGRLLYVVGDATDDHTLVRAGIERCRGVIAALHNDKDNLFCTITARALCPDGRIVAKAVETSAEAKLERAGADIVVSPYRIGALRMADHMVRPTLVRFLDEIAEDHGQNMRIEELRLDDDSKLIGQSLREAPIRDEGVLVIAIRKPDGKLAYNPTADAKLEAGASLIVMATPKAVAALEKECGPARAV